MVSITTASVGIRSMGFIADIPLLLNAAFKIQYCHTVTKFHFTYIWLVVHPLVSSQCGSSPKALLPIASSHHFFRRQES